MALKLAFAALAVLLAAAPAVQAQPYANVGEVLDFTAENITFAILKSLLNQTDLLSDVSNPALKAVVLAPTDDAFERTLAALGDDAAALTSNTTLLRAFLQYHVLPMATPGLPGPGQTFHPTLLGPNITAVNDNGDITFYGVPPGSKPLDGLEPISAGQSVVVVMNDVVIPPLTTSTIAQAAVGVADLTTLVALATADKDVAALVNNEDATVTLFAPNNNAFVTFLRENNLTAAQVLGSTTASRILKSHVVPTRPLFSGDIASGTSTGVPTASSGDTLTVIKNATGVFVGGAGNKIYAQVVAANVTAGKSVVHIIDRVIDPRSPAAAGAPPPPPMSGAASATAVNVLAMAGVALASLLAMIAF